MKAKTINQMNDRCTGCGACEAVCPKDAIDMLLDENGFISPNIKTSQCIECGKCLLYCPLNHVYSSECIRGFYFYLNDYQKLIKSSSGGLAYAIADIIIRNGGVVYGVSYSSDKRSMEYLRVHSGEQLTKIRGSKYAESSIIPYRDLMVDLKSGKKVVVFGLPCQLAGVRAVMGHNMENLFLVELMCLGKSSIVLYQKFISELECKYKANVRNVNMRYKKKDWNVSWIKVDFDNGRKYEKIISSEPFGLLSHDLFRSSCYQCHFKINNAPGDIIIGDFWGFEYLPYSEINRKGMSAGLLMTEKGKQLIDGIDGTLRSVDIQCVLRTNAAIFKSCKKPSYYQEAIDQIKSEDTLKTICNRIYGKKNILKLDLHCWIKYHVPFRLVVAVKRIIHKK